MRATFSWSLLSLCGLVMVAGFSQKTEQSEQAEPTCEQVFKNIKVFNGVPASDMIPAMEFMSASLKYQCSDCHNPKDYSEETRMKETTRQMVIMQREINAKNFSNKLEVTCMTCHGGAEHPTATPVPTGVNLRHERLERAPAPEDLFRKHIAAVGKEPNCLIRTGTLTAPNDETHKLETKPAEFIQAAGGKFLAKSESRTFGSDGKQVWYMDNVMGGEPAAIFNRIGRAWRGETAFDGLERMTVSGKDAIGKVAVTVVRAVRPASGSTEELYFDNKTGLLLRLVNMKRSSIGMVVSSIDYLEYKTISGVKVPMKVVTTFAGDEKWTMSFKSAKTANTADDAIFRP